MLSIGQPAEQVNNGLRVTWDSVENGTHAHAEDGTDQEEREDDLQNSNNFIKIT